MEERFMILEEMLKIETEQNLEVLRNWLVLAAKSDTMEAFLAEAESVKGRQCGQKE